MQDDAHPWKNVSKALLQSLVSEVLSRCNHWDFCFYERERERIISFEGRGKDGRQRVMYVTNKLRYNFDLMFAPESHNTKSREKASLSCASVKCIRSHSLHYNLHSMLHGISVCHCPARLGIGSECSQSDIQRLEAIGHDRTLVV